MKKVDLPIDIRNFLDEYVLTHKKYLLWMLQLDFNISQELAEEYLMAYGESDRDWDLDVPGNI